MAAQETRYNGSERQEMGIVRRRYRDDLYDLTDEEDIPRDKQQLIEIPSDDEYTPTGRKRPIEILNGAEDISTGKKRIIEISSDEDVGDHYKRSSRRISFSLDDAHPHRSSSILAYPVISTSHDQQERHESSTQHQSAPTPELFSQLLQSQNSAVDGRPFNDLSSDLVSAKPATKQLRHNQYTVGWICALPIEMMAAKAMLDEFHIPLPNVAGDDNAYQLGAMGSHNVVITCVRHGLYGTTSATAAAIAMRSSYPNSIAIPLLVGIAGGVPTPDKHDIRLGDVVISTPSSEYPAVLQHDKGKMIRDGFVEQKGQLNMPATALLSVLPHFRTQLPSPIEKVSKHMARAIEKHSLSQKGFARPSSQTDILFGYDNMVSTSGSTTEQQQEHQIQRQPRNHANPELHYGCVASGNQVIKHAPTRDRIALPTDILCFEMEAAGVMDYVPCLVIRGICDYCDAHKSKLWQPYAALAAAAVAKQILALVTANSPKSDLVEDNAISKERQRILDSLQFEDSDSRRSTIRRALPSTCQWLLQQSQVLDWADPTRFHSHRGLLWMKGKPGVGKSTVMKHLVEHTEKLYRDSKSVAVVSFFYNARGGELCRSIVGMYRSLLCQIFEQIPVLQSLVEGKQPQRPSRVPKYWTVVVLEELLYRVFENLGSTHLLCYIDALDECPERQVRDMIRFLESLMELAKDNHFHVCFASRHYPHVSVRHSCEFILEAEAGHTQDICKYLDKELGLGGHPISEELKQRIQAKSRSIFLWVVLVVEIVNREYDHGVIHGLRKILDDIPGEIDDLFRDMLTRDTSNLSRLLISIQWVLFAQTPLTIQELYLAVLYSESGFDMQEEDFLFTSRADMRRYILSCSKGILEENAAAQPKVQFIHETLREFLLQPGVLKDILPGFEGFYEGTSHEALKQCCYQYLSLIRMHQANQVSSGVASAVKSIAFIPYAYKHMLNHAERAQIGGISQAEFLEHLPREYWSPEPDDVLIHNEFPSPHPHMLSMKTFKFYFHLLYNKADLGFVLAAKGYRNLFTCWLRSEQQGSGWEDQFLVLVWQAVISGNWSVFQALLQEYQQEYHIQFATTKHIDALWFLVQQARRKCLDQSFTADVWRSYLTDILTNLRAGSDSVRQQLHQALIEAIKEYIPGNIDVILWLDPTLVNESSFQETAIHSAIAAIHCAIVACFHPDIKILAQNPVDPYRGLSSGLTSKQQLELVKKLRQNGADLSIKDHKGRTPLHVAVIHGVVPIVGFLLGCSISLDVRDTAGFTPLEYAYRLRRYDVAHLFPMSDRYSLILNSR